MGWVMAVGAGISAVSAGVKAVQANNRAKDAAEDAREAKLELDKQKDAFKALDTSNPYLNMENTMEDLTVNTQAAEFQKQQSMQGQANAMQSLRGSAGSSGIAALAQTLASQGSLDAQKASADIAKQEQANQAAERGEAGRLQGLEREGELISRQAEHGKISGLMGMAADDLNTQRQAEQLAIQQRQNATSEMVASGAQAAMGVAGGRGAADADFNLKNAEAIKAGTETARNRNFTMDAQQYSATSAMLGGVGSYEAEMAALMQKYGIKE